MDKEIAQHLTTLSRSCAANEVFLTILADVLRRHMPAAAQEAADLLAVATLEHAEVLGAEGTAQLQELQGLLTMPAEAAH